MYTDLKTIYDNANLKQSLKIDWLVSWLFNVPLNTLYVIVGTLNQLVV